MAVAAAVRIASSALGSIVGFACRNGSLLVACATASLILSLTEMVCAAGSVFVKVISGFEATAGLIDGMVGVEGISGNAGFCIAMAGLKGDDVLVESDEVEFEMVNGVEL